MNITRISSALVPGALVLGLCATAAAQASGTPANPQAAEAKAPLQKQAETTATRSSAVPARASKVIGTDVFYASGAACSSISNLVVSATGQVVVVLGRPDASHIAVPLSLLEPRLKNASASAGEDVHDGSSGETPEVEFFTLRCEQAVCDAAPTVKGAELIDGAWLALSTGHFAPLTTTTHSTDRTAAKSRQVQPAVVGAREPILLGDLMGKDLETAEGVELGEINDVAVDLGTGNVSYVIVSSGGLLGIGASLQAIGFDTLRWSGGTVSIAMTEDDFSKLPKLDILRLAVDPVAMHVGPASKVEDAAQLR